MDELPQGARSEHCPGAGLDAEPHSPIVINDDGDFTSAASGVRGGSGTADDPYVISGWFITGQGAQLGEFLFGPQHPLAHPVITEGILIQDTTKHVLITENVVTGRGYPQGLDFGITVWAPNVRVEANVVCSTILDGIVVYEAAGTTIRANEVRDTRVGVRSLGSAETNLLDNRVEGSVYGISVESSPGAAVRGNRLSGNLQIGILSFESESVPIDSNSIVDQPYADGIYVYRSDGFKVTGNTVSATGGHGVVLGESRNGVAAENLLRGNGMVGLFLWDDQADGRNLLRSNRAEDNGARAGFGFADGLTIAESHANVVEDNVSAGNIGNGFLLFEADRNRLERNSAVDNSRFGFSLIFDEGSVLRANTARQNGTLQGWVGGDEYDGGGIHLYVSGSSVEGNEIARNFGTGVLLTGDSPTALVANHVTGNDRGLVLWFATGKILRRNSIDGNDAGFGIDGVGPEHFDHEIDGTNRVDGRPVMILRGVSGELDWRALDPGYLALVGAFDLTVRNAHARESVQGILVFGGAGVRISGGIFASNVVGVDLVRTRDVTVSGATFDGNDLGVRVNGDTALSSIEGNRFTGGEGAVQLDSMTVPGMGRVHPRETSVTGNAMESVSGLAIDVRRDVTVRVIDNMITGPTELAVSIPRGAVVRGNSLRSLGGDGILVSLVVSTAAPDGPARISGNQIVGPLGTAVDVWMGGDAVVEANSLSGPGTAGVRLRSFYAIADVIGNTIDGFETGIEAAGDGWLKSVDRNVLTRNGTALLKTGGAGALRIAGNVVEANEEGLRLESRGAHTTVECNRIFDNDGTGVAVRGGSRLAFGATVRGNVIEANDTGLEARAAPVGATDNRIAGNATGVLLSDIPAPTSLNENHIAGSEEWGVAAESASGTDVERNWWGDASGPASTLNPEGGGDRAADDIRYSPWLSASPTSAGKCAPSS